LRRKLSALSSLFEHLCERNAVATNPVDGVRAPRRARSLPKALSVDDAVHLVSSGPPLREQLEPDELCNRAMFELMEETAPGLNEQKLSAKVVEIDLRDGQADGRMTPKGKRCPKCDAMMSPKFGRCLFCGYKDADAVSFG